MARRRLGQHFLHSSSILERIAAAVCPQPGGTVIEIGPGKGALTQYLLPRASQLIAIEIDQVLVHYLEQKFSDAPNLTLVSRDVLKTDLAQWGPVHVGGNLPYYITSPIIEKVLSIGPLLQGAAFLVQREVAERIAAAPGSRDYGYLSVQVQVQADARILFHVPPGAFRPPPKVESSVVQLIPRSEPRVPDLQGFLAFASASFGQKRKTLRNNLASRYSKEALAELPEAGLRAEQLYVDDLIRIWQSLSNVPAS